MNKSCMAAVVLSIAAGVTPALAGIQTPAPAGPPKPAAEMGQLKIFLGSIKCSGKQNDSPFGPAHPLRTLSIGTLTLGGFRITINWNQLRTKENPNPLHGIFDVGYDSAGKHYFSYWGDAFGGWGPGTSPGWQGDTLVFTGELNFNGQNSEHGTRSSRRVTANLPTKVSHRVPTGTGSPSKKKPAGNKSARLVSRIFV